MSVPFRVEVDDPDLVVGLVEVEGAVVGASPPDLAAEVDAVVAARAAGEWPPEPVRAAVRDLLRRGGYKPTGRGKPASEFLAQAAARGEFPRVGNAVDALNLVSLDAGLPISLLDADRALAGAEGLVLRVGRAGESYAFNTAGHVIDVEGLLGVAREGGAPIANPVKDSMETKIGPATRRLLAVVYGTRRVADAARVREVAERLGAWLVRACDAAGPAEVRVLAAGAPDAAR